MVMEGHGFEIMRSKVAQYNIFVSVFESLRFRRPH